MRFLILRVFAAVLAVSAASSVVTRAQSDYLAVVTDLEGRIMVARVETSEFEPAKWGIQLFAGDRIQTLENSEVSLLFSNNSLLVLGANSELTISAGPGNTSSRATALNAFDEDLYGTLADLRQQKSTGGALAGLRSDASTGAIELLSPRNTKIRTTRPSFAWEPAESFDEYNVQLFDADGLVWSREVTENHLEYPQDESPLEHDKAYFWVIEGVSLLDRKTSEKAGFQILSEASLSRIAAREAAIEATLGRDLESSSYHLMLGAYYAREGLLESAISSFEFIADRHPDAVLPHEILGQLYSEVGLKDNALSALRKAVTLSRKN